MKLEMKKVQKRHLALFRKEKQMKMDQYELREKYEEAYENMHAAELDRNDAFDGWKALIDKWEASDHLF